MPATARATAEPVRRTGNSRNAGRLAVALVAIASSSGPVAHALDTSAFPSDGSSDGAAKSGARAAMRPPLTSATESEPVRVRLALSKAADERLAELRMRRLFAIELRGVVELDPGPAGPLGNDVVQVWLDVPNPRRALIEVRRTGKALARRALAIGGFSGDVAARVVAIEAAEMARVQAHQRVLSAKHDATARGPVRASPLGSGFSVTSALGVRALPAAAPEWLAGPALELSHHRGITSQVVYGRWLIAPAGESTRWLEAGLGLDAAVWAASLAGTPVRALIGMRAGAASVRVEPRTEGDFESGAPSSATASSARAAGYLALEVSPARGLHVGLAVEPGAVLRPVTLGATTHEGFTLDAMLTLRAAR